MRYNRLDELTPTAHTILNNASELELKDIFERYGEERGAATAAEMIIRYRQEATIETTKQLQQILSYAFFIAKSNNKFQSISRCFQALRIKVNDELSHLDKFLGGVLDHMESPSILAIIAFHSLEARAVYGAMHDWSYRGILTYF
jgi:16S rRNA (cytosine1402-N4)-methyltransferase